MNLLKYSSNIKRSSNRNFAIIFCIFFILITFFLYFKYSSLNIFTISIALFFLFFAFIYPKIFYYPNLIWFYFGIVLGNIISPIIMFIIFYSLIIPTGIFLKIIKKDILNLKIYKNKKTYWNNRAEIKINMKNQF